MDYQIRVENGRNIDFKIEMGTDVTVISNSEQEYVSKQDGPLTQTNRVLSGPSQQSMREGFRKTFKLIQFTQQEIYVIRGLRKALLGQPVIEALQVAQKLFQGLGRLKDNYKIQLLSEAKRFALTTPR